MRLRTKGPSSPPVATRIVHDLRDLGATALKHLVHTIRPLCGGVHVRELRDEVFCQAALFHGFILAQGADTRSRGAAASAPPDTRSRGPTRQP